MIEATVRYGYMMNIATLPSEVVVRRGDRVIVRTDRGTELGDVITVFEQVESSEEENSVPESANETATPTAKEDVPPTDDRVKEPVESRQEPQADRKPSFGPRVLRRATKEDVAAMQEISAKTEPAQFKFCQQKIRELEVPMRLAAVEHLFGGEKIIFYFLAESRVDFRALVRELAREYRTRIEMKQIGARDEAKLLGDYEHCGRELCCRGFIRALEPVTIKMAKSQKATLDPAKISGACGRLMCCLRFENPTYQLLKKQLPRKGRKVTTPKGEGEVINYDIIAQTVYVEESNGEKATYKVEELSWKQKEGGKNEKPENRDEKPVEKPPEGEKKDAPRPRSNEQPRRRDDRNRPRRGDRDRRNEGGNRRSNRDNQQKPKEGGSSV